MLIPFPKLGLEGDLLEDLLLEVDLEEPAAESRFGSSEGGRGRAEVDEAAELADWYTGFMCRFGIEDEEGGSKGID